MAQSRGWVEVWESTEQETVCLGTLISVVLDTVMLRNAGVVENLRFLDTSTQGVMRRNGATYCSLMSARG